MYAIITENDVSQWSDSTGELYHFPKKYLKYLEEGTKVIYYKGKMREKNFSYVRKLTTPHYFGVAEVGKVYPDSASKKNDHYCQIINYIPFVKGIPFKINEKPIEIIPESRKSNYWRDGVRPIDQTVYERILTLANVLVSDADSVSSTSDLNQGSESAYVSYSEGNKKQRYTSYYERNPQLREQAIQIHGYTCQCCSFNFKDRYGEHGEGYIHVHHVKPISEYKGEREVDPKTELIVLCPNCHSMVHRYKEKTLSLVELKLLVQQNTEINNLN